MRRDPTDGFSLIEMLAALLVAALAISVFAGGFGVRNRVPTATDLAKKIALNASALSAQAVATGSMRDLTVDVASRSISTGTVKFDVPPKFTLTVKTGAELITANSKGSILFFADGTSSGGEIELSDTTGVTAIVRISWITGAIQIGRQKT